MTGFLLTWKETGWPYENIVRMVREIEVQGYVEEPWRLAAHRTARPGDRVWLFKRDVDRRVFSALVKSRGSLLAEKPATAKSSGWRPFASRRLLIQKKNY
jgi:hypothetical protein